jgi:ferric-dicitrate binding protein FerR (iron transport regulator)
VQLADLLELPAAEFDAMIDRELERLLGAGLVIAGHRRHRRQVALAAAIVVAAAVAVGWASTGDPSPSGPTSTPTGATVQVVQLSDGSTATRIESAPVPPSDGVNVGSAVEFQRNP